MSVEVDYYAILGVSRVAGKEEIQQAFYKLVRQYHPDARPDDCQKAELRCREINEAYDVLSDPDKRSSYDRQRQKVSRVSPRRHDRPASMRAASMRAGDPLQQFESLIDVFFGGRGSRSSWMGTAAARSGQDIDAELVVTPEEAHYGGRCRFAVPLPELCPHCRGQGGDAFGFGTCAACAGAARVYHRRWLEVNLPRRLPPGAVVRLPRQNLQAVGLAVTGDLLLHIRVRPNR